MTPGPQPIRTTCPYCGVGCGVLARVEASGAVSIKGDPDHPANFGRLCSKGTALGETLSLNDRQLFPHLNGREAGWDEALDAIARAFRKTIAEHGPDAVAIYGSGQLLTEDYYVANKLMKGFIGSANIDTNSRLCMASSVAGHKRAFGADAVPGCYEDLELADLIVIVGSNLAWCHPVLYQRIAAAKEKRPSMRIVLIDPRRTMTADIADLHLPIASDGDVALFVGLLAALAQNGAVDHDYMSRHTSGYVDAMAIAGDWTFRQVAEATGLGEGDIATFFDWFAKTEKVVTVFSQGVNQSETGTDKVNAIINCHLATGRIGRPGMGPFSVTGQPNAMGGREVGGLANMLAAHMELTNPAHRDLLRRFWKAPNLADKPGLKAVDLFGAIEAGKIKAVWIMATNPVDSMPEADRVRAALARCDFVAVSDIASNTDTMKLAHVRLPALGWGEKDGTVTNSERRVSRQRAFLGAPASAKPDWWIICEVARRLGFSQGFNFNSAAEIFAEHAALSAFENDGQRDFDLSGLTGKTALAYDAMTPVQWPVKDAGTPRLFADGVFFTPDARARIVPVVPAPARHAIKGRLTLNTGRVRDHWHTMTRTGKTPRLSSHYAEPFVELHPTDARMNRIGPASLVRLENNHGSAIARALITSRQRPGQVFVPMHWTDQFSSRGRIDALVTARTDPHSGQPALKMSEVSIAPYAPAWHGFALSRSRPDLEGIDYWALARAQAGWRAELAGADMPQDWEIWLRARFGVSEAVQLLSVVDTRAGRRNFAGFEDGRLTFALFVAPEPVAVARQWALQRLQAEDDASTTNASRAAILAGRPGADMPDGGAIVCACYQVGINTIVDAVTRDNCVSVEAIGAALKAGSNCGSCRTEIRGIIDAHRLQAAQ